jgi:hypothetical protein
MLHEWTPDVCPTPRIFLHYLQSYSQYVYTNFGSDKRLIIFIRGKDFVLVYMGQRRRKENVREGKKGA